MMKRKMNEKQSDGNVKKRKSKETEKQMEGKANGGKTKGRKSNGN